MPSKAKITTNGSNGYTNDNLTLTTFLKKIFILRLQNAIFFIPLHIIKL